MSGGMLFYWIDAAGEEAFLLPGDIALPKGF